jgi:UDP-glucose 4-epimerase
MRILVTGASGFLGQAITRHLAEQGHFVVAAGRTPVAHCRQFVPLPEIEVADWRFLVDRADCIIHLAAIAHTRGVPLLRLKAVNCDAAIALARSLESGQKLIFMSSIRAQGQGTRDVPLLESGASLPNDYYGQMKLEAECQLVAHCPQVCILRPVTVYGPGVKAGMRRLSQMLNLPLPLPFAGLIERRSYLSIETLAEAVGFAVHKSLIGRFNLADPEPVSLSELAKWYRSTQGRPEHLFQLPERLLLAGASMLGLHDFAKLAFEPLSVSVDKLRAAGFSFSRTSSREFIEDWARSTS